MTKRKTSRRTLLAGVIGAFGAIPFVAKASTAALTPKATEGPYYPTPSMRRPDIDNDLVKIEGVVEESGGEVFTLRGVVMDRKGRVRIGARVEIWQVDVEGNYLHTRDPRSVNFDPAFQGFGHDITDESGTYVFRTIKPVVYPGRTPHIHVKVFDRDKELLTTQFYLKDEPSNTQDRLYNRMSAQQADAVSMEFVSGENGVEATVNIVA